MDAKTPARGRDRTEGFALEKRRTFHRGTLAEPYPGGLCPHPLGCWPWKAHDVTQDAYDVIQHYGRFGEAVVAVVARVATWRGPKRANVLLQESLLSLKFILDVLSECFIKVVICMLSCFSWINFVSKP
jgi:hypothetical protein